MSCCFNKSSPPFPILGFLICKMEIILVLQGFCEGLLCQLPSIQKSLINGSCFHYIIQTFIQHLLWHSESVEGDKIRVPEMSLIHLHCIGYGELWNKGTYWKSMALSLLPKSGWVFVFHSIPLVLYSVTAFSK